VTGTDPRPRPDLLVKVLAALLAAFALQGAFRRAPASAAIDYYQFWVVGRAVERGDAADVYSEAERARLGAVFLSAAREAAPRSPEERRRSRQLLAARHRPVLETWSTPSLYAAVGSLAGGSYDRDRAAFQRLSLAAYAGAIAVLAASLGHSFAAAALLLAVLVGAFDPFASDLRVGNVNRLLLAALAACLGLLRLGDGWPHRLAAGAVLGAAATFKPNLSFPAATLLLGWMATGRPRRVLGFSAGLAAGAVLAGSAAAAWFGSAQAWVQWAAKFPALLGGQDLGVAQGNYALLRLLEHASGWRPGPAAPALLFAAAASALWLAVRSTPERFAAPRERFALDAGLVAFGAVVSLLVARLAWLHYYVLAIPAVLVLLRPRGSAGAPRRLALPLLALLAIAGETAAPLVGSRPLGLAALASAGAALLFALLLAELRGLREPG
jgi:hypothetical protein